MFTSYGIYYCGTTNTDALAIIYEFVCVIMKPQEGFEPGIYNSLLLEFAVTHTPTQPPRPNRFSKSLAVIVRDYLPTKHRLVKHSNKTFLEINKDLFCNWV